MRIVSKSKFAELCGVDRSSVSKWIKAGLISGEALIGPGHRGKINVDLARRQLALRRDVGQACGNGLKTRLRVDPPAGPKLAAEPAAIPEPFRLCTDSYLHGALVMARELGVTAVCESFDAGISREEAELLYRRTSDAARNLAHHLFIVADRREAFDRVWDESRVELMGWDILVAEREAEAEEAAEP